MPRPDDTVDGAEFVRQQMLKWTEGEWLQYCLNTARQYGWEVDHTFEQSSYARRTARGVPDLFCLKPPEFFWLELKAEKGKVSPWQVRYMDILVEAECRVYYAKPSDDGAVALLFGDENYLYTHDCLSIEWGIVRQREIQKMTKKDRAILVELGVQE